MSQKNVCIEFWGRQICASSIVLSRATTRNQNLKT